MTEPRNLSAHPALLVRLKAVREKTGESRVIRTELENADTRGERPRMVIEGFNIQDAALN